ncbi:MAG: hypothetical protein E6G87_14515 [Alphaproteobacteria bacterium]|nr:MAG: hypothetical protein E6G87_14515 [Alphaproteobacteria bacterium]
MRSAQLRILADLLLPGDAQGLPPGSLVPDVMLVLSESISPIKGLAGSHPDFNDESKRAKLLSMAVIKPYYESGPVLEAMGWRSAPPQPQGHKVAPMDEALAAELARIAGRKRMWR